MRALRPRALVEFVGGPADGTRLKVAVDPGVGRPPDVRLWTHVIADDGAPAVVSRVEYHLREAPDGRAPFWRYVLAGSSEAFGSEPGSDDDDPGE